MATELIHDRGRGPEIEGTRITLDTLLPHFLDPEATEASICLRYELTPEQVAAARAYVLSEPSVALETFLQIEARIGPGNPPEVIERAEKTRAALLSFKERLARSRIAEARNQPDEERGESLTFKEWLAERESRSGVGP